MLDNDIIHKIVSDTYNREIERYGVDIIEETETLFFYDSLCTIKIINLLEGSEGERYRLYFALRGMDIFFEDFQLTLKERHKVAKSMQSNFFKEFGGHESLQKHLNQKYKKYQKSIFSHMCAHNDKENAIEECISIFYQRSEMNRRINQIIISKTKGQSNDERFLNY